MREQVDILIVGGGVMGAAAAWALARRAAPGSRPQRILLLEQFRIGHTRGSSHGGSRIFRYTHPVADEAALMPGLRDLWRTLEADAGASLLTLCGGLFIGEQEGDPFLRACTGALDALSMPYALWDRAEVARRYPQFRLRTGEVALFQQEAGVVAATPAVEAMVRVAQARGVELRTDWRVLGLEPLGADAGAGFVVSCETEGRSVQIEARRVILTAGPWAPGLLRTLLPAWPPLPLTVTHQQVAYFRVSEPASWQADRCPIFIYTADPHVYGFPVYEREGVIKVARELHASVTDPDRPRAPDAQATDELEQTVRERLVNVLPTALDVTPCLYTETPTRDFIIDRHPQWPGLVIAAGFSGRGFKFAPGVGALLADLATGDEPPAASPFWLSRWALERFAHVAPPTGAAPDLFHRSPAPAPAPAPAPGAPV
jgi:sarcosine oxidase